MGEPVSIEMSEFDFVLKGLPDPTQYRVLPQELTPAQWRRLLDDELFWIRDVLRDMHGFRPTGSIKEDFRRRPWFRHATHSGGNDAGTLRVMLERVDFEGQLPIALLLSRGGQWFSCSMQSISTALWFDRLADHQLTQLLERGGWELGLAMLKSIVHMVEDTIDEKQKRLNDMKMHCDAHVGNSLSRLNTYHR